MLFRTKEHNTVWGHHSPLKNKINVAISVDWTIIWDRFWDQSVVFSICIRSVSRIGATLKLFISFVN